MRLDPLPLAGESIPGVREADQGRRGECHSRKTSLIISRLAPLDELTLPPQAGEGPCGPRAPQA